MEKQLTIDMLRDFASKNMVPGTTVWLYGSRARGDYGPHSDWDLLVLIDKDKITDDDFDKFAQSFILYGCQFNADVSPQLYTYKDWERHRITPYYQNIEEDKVAIF